MTDDTSRLLLDTAVPTRAPNRAALVRSLVGVTFATLFAALLPSSPKAACVAALVVATLGIIFFLPRLGPLPSHVWGPTLAALALLAWPIAGVEPSSFGEQTAKHLPVIVLILSLAYVSLSLDDAGFFRWCAERMLAWADGSGDRLFVALFFGVSALTLFTSNDVVILAVTPIVLYVGRIARMADLTPFLMALFVAANTASMALYGGNPTNIIIASAVGLGPLDYARRMLLPALVATLTAFVVLRLRFARAGRLRLALPERLFAASSGSPDARWTGGTTFRAAVCALCPILLAAPGATVPPGEPTSTARAALVVGTLALVLLVADVARDLRSGSPLRTMATWRRFRRLPFDIAPFLLAFSLLVGAAAKAGLADAARTIVDDLFANGLWVGSLATAALGILTVNVTGNIPATMFFERLWTDGTASFAPIRAQLATHHPLAPEIFIDGCLYASNFGANLTFVGALAGLLWMRLIRSSTGELTSRVPTVMEFTAFGLCVVPPVTLATALCIALLRAGLG